MSTLLDKIRPELHFNKYSFINSIKAILACSIGLIVVNLLHLAQPQWVLISIIIVMASQYRLGGAMLKGYARLLATAIGSSIAAIIIFLFADHLIAVYALVFIFIALFVYLATNSKEYSYSYALGAVTMVIIVISATPQIHNAFDRLLEIVLGVLIAILVSRFILPIHASHILNANIAKTLELLKEVYRYSIKEEKTFQLHSEEPNLEEKIIQNMAAQPILLKEACTESIAVRQNKFKYIIMLRLERRLLRSIYMLHHTLRVSLRTFSDVLNIADVKLLHKNIITTLDVLATRLRNPKTILPTLDLNKSYQDIITSVRNIFNQYSFEDKNKIHAYLFCLGHVIILLNRMKKIIIEIDSYSAQDRAKSES